MNPEFQGRVILGKPSQWFNPNAFLPPPVNSGFYGDLGRNTLLGPGLARWDFSLLKETTLHERLAANSRDASYIPKCRNISSLAWPRAATTCGAFNAVVEPRRRDILDYLALKERSVSAIVAGLRMKQPSISKAPPGERDAVDPVESLVPSRGQLSVYLRLLDVPSAVVYWHRADENPLA